MGVNSDNSQLPNTRENLPRQRAATQIQIQIQIQIDSGRCWRSLFVHLLQSAHIERSVVHAPLQVAQLLLYSKGCGVWRGRGRPLPVDFGRGMSVS